MWSIRWWHILAGATIAVFAWEVAQRFFKRRRFRGRTCLRQQEILSLFKTGSLKDQDLLRLLCLVSRVSSVPLGLLRPGDRFEVELAPVRGLGFDDGIFLLDEVLVAEFDAQQGEIDQSAAKDLRGLLQQIALVRRRQLE